MAAGRPQYHENKLDVVALDEASLEAVLVELQEAIHHGLDLIETSNDPPDSSDPDSFGNIFTGSLGLSVLYSRLCFQKESVVRDGASLPREVEDRVRNFVAGSALDLNLQPGRVSPLTSPRVGAIFQRFRAGCPILSASNANGGSDDAKALYECLQSAIDQFDAVPFRGAHRMGIDEVWLGRAGLLWGLLNLHCLELPDTTRQRLRPVFAEIPNLAGTILDAGIRGARLYETRTGMESPLPLMWTWIDEYHSLGAMHGAAGILTVLLCCNVDDLQSEEHLDPLELIVRTVGALCKHCIQFRGHLLLSIPERPTSRSSPLVQLCHGAPGMLLLLSAAKQNRQVGRRYWQPYWNEAMLLCSEVVWEQGLLSKGGGLCHGIAGNAWPLLLLHVCLADYQPPAGEENPADLFLSRALAFLLHARMTPPFNGAGSSGEYRMPDSPYSLFEGLAGTICAWAEACVVIKARLQKRPPGPRMLGVPGLGGVAPKGYI